MSIGIYDADMATYTLVPFNLQAMKLSAYYKKKRELVVLAKQFDPSRNQQIYYVKDWDDGNYPSSITQNKVIYLGHAFSGTEYIPLDEEIEMMRPDTSLYDIMEEKIQGNNSAFRRKIFKDMSKGEHCRISLDGKNIWKNSYSQFKNLEKCKNIMFHDYDLEKIDGSFEFIKEILNNTTKNPQIGMKFPITVYNGDSLLKWSTLRPNAIFYSMRYNGLIDNKIFSKWVSQYHNNTVYSQLEYNLTYNTTEREIISKLQDIYHQVVNARSYGLKISLKYTEDFFQDKRYEKIIDLFNFYEHSMLNVGSHGIIHKVQTDTLFDFAKAALTTYGKYPKMFTKQEIKQLFHFVGEINPDLFRDFYELTAQYFIGGQI